MDPRVQAWNCSTGARQEALLTWKREIKTYRADTHQCSSTPILSVPLSTRYARVHHDNCARHIRPLMIEQAPAHHDQGKDKSKETKRQEAVFADVRLVFGMVRNAHRS